MKNISRYSAAILIALTLTTSQATASPVLQTTTVNGLEILQGAIGVKVGQLYYDVQFKDGRCDNFYATECTTPATGDEAIARIDGTSPLGFSIALKSQVFDGLVDGTNIFDTHSDQTNGCEISGNPFCIIITPVGSIFDGTNQNIVFECFSNGNDDGLAVRDGLCTGGMLASVNTADIPFYTIAVWSQGYTVPEPSSIASSIIALALLTISRRTISLRKHPE